MKMKDGREEAQNPQNGISVLVPLVPSRGYGPGETPFPPEGPWAFLDSSQFKVFQGNSSQKNINLGQTKVMKIRRERSQEPSSCPSDGIGSPVLRFGKVGSRSVKPSHGYNFDSVEARTVLGGRSRWLAGSNLFYQGKCFANQEPLA